MAINRNRAPRIVDWHQGRQPGEDSPPHDSRSQHAARSEAVGEPSTYGLKECIADQHRAEHVAQLHVAQAVIRGDRSPGNRNVDPVKVRNCAQDEQPAHQKPAHMARPGAVHHRSSEMSLVRDVPITLTRNARGRSGPVDRRQSCLLRVAA